MMRRVTKMLMLAGLFTLTACGADDARLTSNMDGHGDEEHGESDQSGDSYDDAHGAAHGEVHDFSFAVGEQSDSPDFEAGAEMRAHTIIPDAPFRGVKVMITAAKLDLEYRIGFADGEATEWQPLAADQSVDRFHNAHMGLNKDATEFHFRSNSPMSYVRFEFFEEPVDSADSHDDIGTADDVRRHALARPGRYQPPADVRTAGVAQAGNFGYDSAPAYNGGRNCSGTFTPGARQLGNFLVDNFEGAAYFQGYNCRRVRGSSSMSMHGTGRAIDVFVPKDTSQSYDNQGDNDLGNPIANYLIENATELGIQYFIWDQASWSIRTGLTRTYGGVHPHNDHLHIELTEEAANSNDDAFPSSFNPHFADDDESVHEDAINIIYDEGITRGCADDPEPLYCPQDTETRANVAVMLMRAFDLERSSQDHFHDDDASNAEAAINALAARGVNTVCTLDDARRFCPAQNVTRGQFALWLDGLLSLEESTQDYFVDDSGRTYQAAVNRLAAAGITRGCSADMFCGSDLITRGEIASLLARAIGKLEAHEPAEPNRPIEIVLQWTSDDIDLDLSMRSPDIIDYQDDSPSAQGWLHSSDTCPDDFGPGCNDTAVDGAFSETIWLSTEGVFGTELPEPTLQNGDRGDEVETLQAALNHAGFDAGPADGIFGNKTRQGLEALQSTDDSVEVSGVYDEPTRELLSSRLRPGEDYSIEVETFGQEASSARFDLLVLKDGKEVESYTGQTAPPLGESTTFEFSLRE